MYPSTSLFIAIGQLAIVVLVLFSYPLQVHPCRNCLDKIFHAGHAAEAPKADSGTDEDEDEGEPNEDEHGHGPHAEMSKFKYTALTSAIIIGGFTIAYLVDDLQIGQHEVESSILCSETDCVCSSGVCWGYWLDDDFLYFTGFVLLEGNFLFLHCHERSLNICS